MEWATHDVLLPGTPDLGGDPQVAYRAMDALLARDAAIQEHVFFAVAGRLGLECDVLLWACQAFCVNDFRQFVF